MPPPRGSSLLIVMFMCVFLIFCMISWSKSAASGDVRMLSVNDVLSRSIWTQGSKSDIPVKVKEAYDSWHECISDALLPKLDDPEQLWSSFRGAVNTCYDRTPMKSVNLTGVKNKDEFKVHIFNNTDNTPSVVITLGVGWDVLAEQKLKKLLPNGTLFFGADPMYEENAALYSTVGQFFPLAIGNETKLSKAFVMPKQLKERDPLRITVGEREGEREFALHK
ncbi:hypothetical protein ANCCAN_12494 [Ancylostoma caninum]|uniref:Methyltransferase FkbM domain-containing protein n=1 Tax=Ancylostoma caninum TaxID=29170 RepID=A0A368GAV8_ANCCA|nr:hypothetical protein ANCCAN_12494 [Ancylostoma caninum]